MIIYRALNTFNGKSYIGATKQSLKQRIASHLNSALKPQSKFHRAIRKYGRDLFDWGVIEDCNSVEQLEERERYWILAFDSKNLGYNTSDGEYLKDLGRGRRKKTRKFTTRSGIPGGDKWLAWHTERSFRGLCYCLKCYHNPVKRQYKGLCPSAQQGAGQPIRQKQRHGKQEPAFRFPSGVIINGLPWWSDPSLAR